MSHAQAGAGRPVVVITGASSGIGRATARAHARRRARLVLAGRNRDSLEQVASECRARGADVLVVPTDVADEAAVQRLVAAAIDRFGRIDVWVGAAGVFSYGGFAQTPPEVFRQVIETNLMGQVHGARAVLPHFRRQGRGTLVLVASLYSKIGSPNIAPYVTSKFGLLGFAEVLRAELRGERGIRVRVILPSTVDTPIYQNAANYTGRDVHPLPPATSPRRVARAIVRAPGRRRFAVSVGHVQRGSRLVRAASPAVYDFAKGLLMNTVELRAPAPRTEGTVFAPPAVAGEVSGGWRSPVLRLVTWTAAAAAATALIARRQRKPSD
jgi:short-subunit dehydrogenase